MEYVNKSTGEIIKAEVIDLTNINDGELNDLFRLNLSKLSKELLVNDGKGSINICVKAEIGTSPDGDTTVYLESSIAVKYPKRQLGDSVKAKIGENGQLVQCQQASMFDNKQKK